MADAAGARPLLQVQTSATSAVSPSSWPPCSLRGNPATRCHAATCARHAWAPCARQLLAAAASGPAPHVLLTLDPVTSRTQAGRTCGPPRQDRARSVQRRPHALQRGLHGLCAAGVHARDALVQTCAHPSPVTARAAPLKLPACQLAPAAAGAADHPYSLQAAGGCAMPVRPLAALAAGQLSLCSSPIHASVNTPGNDLCRAPARLVPAQACTAQALRCADAQQCRPRSNAAPARPKAHQKLARLPGPAPQATHGSAALSGTLAVWQARWLCGSTGRLSAERAHSVHHLSNTVSGARTKRTGARHAGKVLHVCRGARHERASTGKGAACIMPGAAHPAPCLQHAWRAAQPASQAPGAGGHVAVSSRVASVSAAPPGACATMTDLSMTVNAVL